MNKWRLATLWILGFITLMAVLNLTYAVVKGTQLGNQIYTPFMVGALIGEMPAIQYFWISAIPAGLFIGMTLLVFYSPFSLTGGRLAMLQPIFGDNEEWVEDEESSRDGAVNSIHETLQEIQATVQANTTANGQASADITKNLLMDYQIFRNEMLASLKRQEQTNQLLTLLTLSTLFDRNTPGPVIRSSALPAMTQALPMSLALDLESNDYTRLEEEAELIDHEGLEERAEITEQDLRNLIEGPVRIKAAKGRRVFRKAKRPKQRKRFVVY